MNRHVVLCSSVLLACLLGGSRASAESLKAHEMRPLLGTVVTVDVCFVDGRQDDVSYMFTALWDRLQQINDRMNAYDPNSDVSRLNNAQGQEVSVHKDVLAVIKKAFEMTVKTQGVFDITVAPLVKVWKEASAEDRYPTVAELEQAKAAVGIDNVDVGPTGVRLLGEGVQIDLGGLAQGYAADESYRVLKEAGFHHFMVDAGGEIRVSGQNCQGKTWRVGVRDPDNRRALMDVVELRDAAVSTSGDYEKHIMVQGQKWSHIINPITGYPQNGVASATVVAPTAIEADVFSTALCVLGPRQSMRLIRELGAGYEALVVFRRSNGELEWHSTPGYELLRVEKKGE